MGYVHGRQVHVLMNKNLWLLIFSQIFAFTAAPVTVFLSGIIGSNLSPTKSLATLPMAVSVVGIALFAFFAAKLMSIVGRRLGFIYASVGTCLASLITAYSIIIESFFIFNLGCFLIGGGIAFSHQYRFAAVEVVEKDYAPKAISIILLAGIGSAFIGPNIANISKDIIHDHLYAGSYLALSVLAISSTIFLLFYKEPIRQSKIQNKSGRSYLKLISQPRFLQALIASGFAYAVMSFLMTATPISMHVMENMSLNKTSIVIQFHVAAMFLPSLLTGHLIKRFGHSNVIYAGVFLYSITLITSIFDQSFFNYMFALIFLGLGWNFLFISGTSLLVLTYREEEKYRAQGLNDFVVYSIHAIGSLSAGVFIALTNWKIMNMICIPFMILIIFTTIRAEILDKKKP